ncbi:unnamed protein product [Darwinula stevensoni]|uniref:Uncharacterized protein n=1 Tax=Darwinula stevensoni TaxID=69355 RepID=A0A7R8X455_9CRUS|nr:unnamed protein product [Darwinula stevensoni]CAG0885681.1 unnamed protein product [Darwinula stevensoni]
MGRVTGRPFCTASIKGKSIEPYPFSFKDEDVIIIEYSVSPTGKWTMVPEIGNVVGGLKKNFIRRLDESRPADNKEERVEILKEEPLKPPARDPRRKSSLFGRLRKSMRRKNWKPARKVLDSHDLSPPEQHASSSSLEAGEDTGVFTYLDHGAIDGKGKTLGWKPKIPESLSTYRMKPEGVRGRAIIFNHKVFDSKLRLLPREGTEVDVKNLSRVLSARGLHVQVHHDLTYRKLIRELKDIATEEKALASHDCFVVCFLSHGKEGRLYARDRDFDELELWREFYGDRCEALIGKPKMFFVQACRGRTPDSGVKGKHARRGWYPHHDTTDGEGGGHRGEHGDYHLPTHADLLIAQASYEGQVAWKNEDLGSYFIYTLCEVMEQHSETLDVLKMLTMVSEIIALQFKSSHDEPEYHDKKQIPTIRSTLISEVYLKPIPRH